MSYKKIETNYLNGLQKSKLQLFRKDTALEKTPQSEERVKAKNYYKMATYRLLRKAEANIKAVEKGMFGVGH